MPSSLYRFFRFLFLSIAIIHLTAAIIVFINTPVVHSAKHPEIALFLWWSDLFMAIVITVIGSSLAIMLKRASYHIFLAGALILFGIGYTWLHVWADNVSMHVWSDAVLTSATGALFIYSMVRFAGKHSRDDYNDYFKLHKRSGWYRSIVIFFSKDNAFWLVLFPLFFALAVLGNFTSNVVGLVINIVILIIGFIYFRVSYHFSGKENQNRLSWLLWGLVSIIALYITELLLWLLYPQLLYLRICVYIITCLVICFSFIMSIFFSHGTDATIVVRKTLIYSALFLAGLFLFGVLEHLVIHSVAHLLHVESSILNSCVGAAIALLIRPLHHKVEHSLNKWEENKKQAAEKKSIVLQKN